jgi:hypothetical protein
MQCCKPYAQHPAGRFIKDRLTVYSTANPLHTMLLYGYTGWVVQALTTKYF